MAYNKNLNIGPNNVVNISGSLITITGSLTGSEFSGSRLQSTIVSASVVSASQYLGLNLTASVITGSELNIDYIDFSGLTPTPDYQSGRLYYDGTGSYFAGTELPDININLGQELLLRVHNPLPTTLTKGTIVKITGSLNNSDTPRVTTASWDNDAGSATTLGVVVRDIATTAEGYIILNGVLRNINTDAFELGQMLYLSSSGNWTNVVPVSPKHEVRVAQVIRKASNGTVFVRVQNGYELGELHDVLETDKQNGDLLVYESSTNLWKNSKILSGSYVISGGLGLTGSLSLTSDIIVSTSPDGLGVTVGNGAGTSFTNTVVGYNSLNVNTTGINNSALGNQALGSNRTGENNVAVGHVALLNNISGSRNVAVGSFALNQNTNAVDNVAIGNNALNFNTASNNIAIGSNALFANRGGDGNIAIGVLALTSNRSGSDNIVLGRLAASSLADPSNSSANIFIGLSAGSGFQTGSNNIFLGRNAGAGLNNLDDTFILRLGNNERVRINSSGNFGIGTTTPNARLDVSGSAIITSNLTVSGSISELSSRKIKKDITSLKSELSTVSKLNPVSYTRLDDGRREYGFISEEMRQVYPEFVIGEAINYPKMVSVLVSAVKELTEKLENQNTEIELLKNKLNK